VPDKGLKKQKFRQALPGTAVGEFPPLIAVQVLGLNCQHCCHLAIARDEVFPRRQRKVGFSIIKPCSSNHQSAESISTVTAPRRRQLLIECCATLIQCPYPRRQGESIFSIAW